MHYNSGSFSRFKGIYIRNIQAGGDWNNTIHGVNGSEGNYWSTLYGDSISGCDMSFTSSSLSIGGSYRRDGNSICPVANQRPW